MYLCIIKVAWKRAPDKVCSPTRNVCSASGNFCFTSWNTNSTSSSNVCLPYLHLLLAVPTPLACRTYNFSLPYSGFILASTITAIPRELGRDTSRPNWGMECPWPDGEGPGGRGWETGPYYGAGGLNAGGAGPVGLAPPAYLLCCSLYRRPPPRLLPPERMPPALPRLAPPVAERLPPKLDEPALREPEKLLLERLLPEKLLPERLPPEKLLPERVGLVTVARLGVTVPAERLPEVRGWVTVVRGWVTVVRLLLFMPEPEARPASGRRLPEEFLPPRSASGRVPVAGLPPLRVERVSPMLRLRSPRRLPSK